MAAPLPFLGGDIFVPIAADLGARMTELARSEPEAQRSAPCCAAGGAF